MTRISVVTGAASGIGKATKELLEQRGGRVIGVDIHGTDVTADLSTPAGRTALVQGVRDLAEQVDAVYAVAGLATPTPATVAVNFFGTVATLDGLRPLLAGSPSPRAVLVSSMAALMPSDPDLVSLLTAGDEAASLARAEVLAREPETTGGLIYASTKLALSRWVRRQAATPEWAGAGIPLNAVAPGIIATPMTAGLIDTAEGREALLAMVPMPLNGIAEPIAVARLLAWLGGEENTHLCGQVVYIDGGSDAVLRGDSVW
ncbi:SDR family NAD(P)-dependent oxidoreductase [Pseudarthrobacter sp. AG30]|uniref:SDR family oxidoreductase n=1 Tax=Micrococcaceae TaxID=1268 RepID=UPI000D64BA3E|nr:MULTISPECIES: SDR family oxidoreductase [Micrococcaceae]RAX18148.1 SDR family NAD(P)-dependent oxidoreductase [Pseudarthrobacter sp. AG30]TDT80138.1 NAD(P)-dependent dehydrogenase (short-subunit alcohol dehydrogenase family) [Arthrobacter sp. AG258]